MTRFRKVFGAGKPVIGMVHLGALPGAPLHDGAGGVEKIIVDARADLMALQAAGFDAVMFGNENDRPYEFRVDMGSTATMACVIGRLRPARSFSGALISRLSTIGAPQKWVTP